VRRGVRGLGAGGREGGERIKEGGKEGRKMRRVGAVLALSCCFTEDR